MNTRAPDLSIDETVLLLINEVRRLGAKRVVIDSLSGLELSLPPTFRDDFRESLLQLVAVLARAGVTVLVTSELEDRYTDLRFSPYGAAFLTDAIIVQGESMEHFHPSSRSAAREADRWNAFKFLSIDLTTGHALASAVDHQFDVFRQTARDALDDVALEQPRHGRAM